MNALLAQVNLVIVAWVGLLELFEACEAVLASLRLLQVLNNSLNFSLNIDPARRGLGWLLGILAADDAATHAGRTITALKDDENPLLESLILAWMLLNDSEMLPDAILLETHGLINQRLGNTKAQVVVVCLLLVAAGREVVS